MSRSSGGARPRRARWPRRTRGRWTRCLRPSRHRTNIIEHLGQHVPHCRRVQELFVFDAGRIGIRSLHLFRVSAQPSRPCEAAGALGPQHRPGEPATPAQQRGSKGERVSSTSEAFRCQTNVLFWKRRGIERSLAEVGVGSCTSNPKCWLFTAGLHGGLKRT